MVLNTYAPSRWPGHSCIHLGDSSRLACVVQGGTTRSRAAPAGIRGGSAGREAGMPSVTITRVWPDDDKLQVSIEVEHAYPDELDEAANLALKTFAEAHGITLAATEEPT